MYEQLQIDPPLEIPEFLDHLHATNQRIVPGSLIWLPHPTKSHPERVEGPGWWVPAVRVEDIERKELSK